MGEIGGDDFNYAFSQGKSIQELQDLVPDVVGAIINAVRVSSLPIHISQLEPPRAIWLLLHVLTMTFIFPSS